MCEFCLSLHYRQSAFPARKMGAKAEGKEGSLGIMECIPVSQNPQGDLYLRGGRGRRIWEEQCYGILVGGISNVLRRDTAAP